MKPLWDKLGTLYQSKSLVNKLLLWKKLYNLRMKDGDSVTEHLNAFNIIVSQLASIDIKIPDEERHFKGDCKSKAPDKGKGSDDAPSVEVKTTSDEGGDVYLASSSTHVDQEAWLINSGASFDFTPHREYFCEYDKYDGGDVFLGDDKKARIVGSGKVKLKLQGGRVRTLPHVLNIPTLVRNLISIRKLDDAGVKTVFEKDTYKMVRGALALMRGVRTGTLYKLKASTTVDGCNSSVVPKSGVENIVVSGEKTMMWHQRLGHIGEKGL
eukprot:PITA_26489